MWKPQKILTLNTSTKEWTKTEFSSFKQWRDFVASMWKEPGEYSFKNTEYWREAASKFEKDKKYCDYHHTSKEYKEHWLLERRKCEQGIIVDGVYISPNMYFFWNYCRIPNKIEGRETFPEIWDGHYHLDLYQVLAELYGEDAAGTKSRQKGISLYEVALIARQLWFGNKNMLKIVAQEEEYVLGEWGILQTYRNHLNDHTGWYRAFSPDESLNWEQKRLVTEGTTNKKSVFKGNFCKIKGLTTKMNVTRAVGGAAKYIYITEAGINKKLLKVKEYVDPNMKMGNVKTGMFIAIGSVGETVDCQDLMELCFNPKAYNIRVIKTTSDGKEEETGFFFPEEWNYTHQDDETGEVIRCYDKDGNSNISLAVELIEREDAKQKLKKDPASYRLWKSQHPRTLRDAFDQREDNPFPTELLKEQQKLIIGEKRIIVSLEKDFHGKITHKFSDHIPISKIKPNPNEDNRGAVVVYEFPIDKPPFGLYYAGVDPIYNLDTSTSGSLMSITVWIGTHERDGKIVEPYPVCEYTGRHKNVRDTYSQVALIIEWYNARTAVESNVKDFTEWMIRQGKSRFLMRRKELTVISEMSQNSTIRDEIGVRMEANFKQRALEKFIAWLQTPVSTEFDMETGESNDIYNVSKLRDPMLIKEMLQFTPKLNTDRIVSNLLAIIAVQSDTNRHIITGVKNPFKELPKQTTTKLPNAFASQRTSHFKKIPSPFGKR
jgi:hypothetical protein